MTEDGRLGKEHGCNLPVVETAAGKHGGKKENMYIRTVSNSCLYFVSAKVIKCLLALVSMLTC